MATAKPVVASYSSASITRNANFPSKSHIITESLPHQSTNDEKIINVQNQRKRFTSEELKKFDENRRKTYEGRSNSIKATIQFKAIQDATAEEHLIGIADLIGFENIHSIGRINGQAIVSVANTELAESLLTKGFKVGNEVIYPSPLFRTSKKYILSGVLSFIQDKDIEKALEPYGHMISIRPIPFPTENPLLKHLSSLRREVVFKTKENASMPAVISINYMDQTFKIFIGEDVTCSGCRRHGHIRTRCPFDPEIREKVTRSFADALYPTSQPQTPKRPPTERDVPTAREIWTSSKKTHPATSPDRKSRPTPPGGGKATHSCSESDISTGTFSLREETSLRCEEWSMDSSQLQNELKECEKGDNPEVDKIIATIYRRANLSRQTKVLQQLEIYPDLETKISRHLKKWEDIKFKTFDDLDFDQRKAINDKRSQDITDSLVTKSRQDSGRQGTSKQVDHCLYRKMEQGREENPKEPMESDPDSESGENTFPKKENTLGRTEEIAPGQEDVTPPPPVSDVRGRLTTTLHQLSAVTGHRERWNRYDGSYEAQSFFTNYDAQADRAQLQCSTRLRKPANPLQAPLRATNTRASTWMTEWHRVVFSDESRFCLSSDSRRVRVWRRRGERSNPAAIVERPTVRQRGIMVWGAIAYDSRSPLLRIQGTMTAQRYVDDVLRPVTLPYLQGVPNALYQQDNARPHTARISQQALKDVQMLPWPPYSPDLSPIEHVWDIIGRRLHALPQPRSEDELWQMYNGHGVSRILESDTKSLSSLTSGGHSRRSSDTSQLTPDDDEDAWEAWGKLVADWDQSAVAKKNPTLLKSQLEDRVESSTKM
ncbi:EVI5L [Cordylochernes scorpioides]|uniref:EVI5L n=1 Tax=Cordylochernes scorpioides TaxID=51811 RepID=A0ABY6KMP7_9ARAC|nr:EVI5L [Cordylochernes scorpioides]